MVKFTLEENWEILKTFFQSGESLTGTARKLRPKFEKNKAPSKQFVDSFVKRVRETGSLMDKPTRLRARPVRSIENIAAVAESVNDNPSTSTRHRAQELDISRTSLQRILTKDLRLRPYKIQLV